MNRRRFIQSALAASAIAVLRVPDLPGGRPVSGPKNGLILGGTNFLGPAVVQAAVVVGYSVTLFNRGITNPELLPHFEKPRGLRSATAAEENWAALGRRRWDAVIDVWPSDPALAGIGRHAAPRIGSPTTSTCRPLRRMILETSHIPDSPRRRTPGCVELDGARVQSR